MLSSPYAPRSVAAGRFFQMWLPCVFGAAREKMFRKKQIKNEKGKVLSIKEVVQKGERIIISHINIKAQLPRLTGMQVLDESAAYMAIDKPAGMASVAGVGTKGRDAKTALETLFGLELITVHRLDKHTSGVLLFAKEKTFARKAEAAFKQRKVVKIYEAVVAGAPPKKVDITLPLIKKAAAMKVWKEGDDKAKKLSAHTTLTVLCSHSFGARVQLMPKTGRMHQLRVHCAASGYPIVGDSLYGGPPFKRMLLHAKKLEICELTFLSQNHLN